VEYLALVYGDPDSWETMSESDRATAYEGYMAVARDARGGCGSARRRGRARVDRSCDERACPRG